MNITKYKKHGVNTARAIVLVFVSLILFLSCSRSSKVCFMGKELNTPKKEFVKHLEDNGFILDGNSYIGKYLDEDVFIILVGEEGDFYKSIVVSSVFADLQKANEFFEKACRTISKEHYGFKETDESSFGMIGREFSNQEGGTIKVLYAMEPNNMAMVSIAYYVEHNSKETSDL